MTVRDYLSRIERLFLLSPAVASFEVKEHEERPQEGFIRMKGMLSNGDLLDAFEFVVAAGDEVQTLRYRIHWQGEDGRLKQRWDNAPHHKGIPSFPHHVHQGWPEVVGTSEPMTIEKVLTLVTEEFRRDERYGPGTADDAIR